MEILFWTESLPYFLNILILVISLAATIYVLSDGIFSNSEIDALKFKSTDKTEIFLTYFLVLPFYFTPIWIAMNFLCRGTAYLVWVVIPIFWYHLMN